MPNITFDFPSDSSICVNCTKINLKVRSYVFNHKFFSRQSVCILLGAFSNQLFFFKFFYFVFYFLYYEIFPSNSKFISARWSFICNKSLNVEISILSRHKLLSLKSMIVFRFSKDFKSNNNFYFQQAILSIYFAKSPCMNHPMRKTMAINLIQTTCEMVICTKKCMGDITDKRI